MTATHAGGGGRATTPVRPLQIWAHKAEPSRRLLVLRVACGQACGFGYHQHQAATRDVSVPVVGLAARYRLVEDTPAHLLAQVQARPGAVS
ncbi:hypothetical protein [Microbispora triticiradicis]|uniref:hypothetical protein n=1 Tax=Microbispora triticiradicis TaxID=2200763 RepID=UPI001AD72C40|nr:hypothetical protein [Microbispora triticiradicis]